MELDKIKNFASPKVTEASVKKLEPLVNLKKDLELHYTMSNMKADLHYLVAVEQDANFFGQMMVRIQGEQVGIIHHTTSLKFLHFSGKTAFSANKKTGRVVVGSREPQRLDEYVYFYFYLPSLVPKDQDSFDRIWKVFAKRKAI